MVVSLVSMGKDDWEDWEDDGAPPPPPPRRASMFTEPIAADEAAAPLDDEQPPADADDGEPAPPVDSETGAIPAPSPAPRGSEETEAEKSAQLFDANLPVGYEVPEDLGAQPQRLNYDFLDQPDDEPLPVAWSGVMRPDTDPGATGSKRPAWAGRRRKEPVEEPMPTASAVRPEGQGPVHPGEPAPAAGWTGPERETTTTVPKRPATQGSSQRSWLYLPIAVAVGILIGIGGFLGIQKFGGGDGAPAASPTPTASASVTPSFNASPAPLPSWPAINATPLEGLDLGSRTQPQSVEEPGSYPVTDTIWQAAGPGWGLYVWRSADRAQQNLYLVSPEGERFLLYRLRTDITIDVQHWDPSSAQSWLKRTFDDGSMQTIQFDMRRGVSTEDWIDGFDKVSASYLTTLRDGRDLWVTLTSVSDASAVVAYDPVANSAEVLPGLEQALEPTGAASEAGYQVVVAALPDPGRSRMIVSQEVSTWEAGPSNEQTTVTFLDYDLAAGTQSEVVPPEVDSCVFEFAMLGDDFVMTCAGQKQLVDAAGATVRPVADVELPNPVMWKATYTETPAAGDGWQAGVTYSRE